MEPPLVLTFSTRDGTELPVIEFDFVSDTEVVTTLPRLRGASSYAWADVTLTDAKGRTAFLFHAMQYDPGWQPYAWNAVVFVMITYFAICAMPNFVREGCEPSAWREQLVWRTLDRRVGRASAMRKKPAQRGKYSSVSMV